MRGGVRLEGMAEVDGGHLGDWPKVRVWATRGGGQEGGGWRGVVEYMRKQGFGVWMGVGFGSMGWRMDWSMDWSMGWSVDWSIDWSGGWAMWIM